MKRKKNMFGKPIKKTLSIEMQRYFHNRLSLTNLFIVYSLLVHPIYILS
jgi:hypothetical protein